MSDFSISSLLNSTTSISNTSAQKLQDSLNNSESDTTDEKLLEVCKSFESYFVEQVIKEARKTVSSEDDEGEYMQYFGDILNQQYASAITDQSDLGLAQQLYESMKRQ
ncbi:flagellar protein FlgJ [Lachnospiraceae bacterium KM106-2]|nr:flagellar protein FlgJ [Lachnospiraceae bacterium KM106-2]